MLKPLTLDSLNTDLVHYFCSLEDCDVVYLDTDKNCTPYWKLKFLFT
ncbi:hypothetical protein [Domibacillus aminovorans]|nr:hypothetical protein [Domibacillus aminovorans]